MKTLFAPVISAFLAVTLMGCQQSLNQLQTSTTKAVGTLELTFDSLTNKATALVHAGNQTRAVQTNANVTFSAPAILGVLTDVGNNVQYINAKFNVNNLLGSSLTDLTIIAYQKTGNMGGTALKDVYNFVGSSIYPANDPTGVAFAQAVKPVNPPNSVSPFVVNNAGSDLQLFTESELPSLQTAANTANELVTASGEYLLPYGFVARNSATSRILAANTNNAGTVNIGIQVPTGNSSAANTGYRFTMTFVIFDTPVATRVSESLHEQGTGSGANTRKTSFAASELFALGGSSLLSDPSVKRGCALRTAGTAASPSAKLVNTFNLTAFSPVINVNTAAQSANIDLTSDQNVNAPAASNWLVRGDLTGDKPGAISGSSSSTLTFNPINNFKPGEVVTAFLKSGAVTTTTGGGSCVIGADGKTWQFRAGVGTGGGTFGTKTDFGTAAGPFAILGDTNNDGNLDIVNINDTSNSVSILLGNGSGSFGAKTDFTTGSTPYTVALGDLNSDGKLDIVTANQAANSASVLINNGSNTFAAKVDYTAGSQPYSVALSDVSSDGKLDMIVSNYISNTVSVFIGNGNGTFNAKMDYATGSRVNSTTIGDVNNDGKPDIIAVNQVGFSASVLLGNGNGTFQAKIDYATASNPISMALGDVNNDGNLDIITANQASGGVFGASVLIGNGNGTFNTKVDYNTGDFPYSVALGDINGDGKLDIAVGNYNSSSASVLTGIGNGTFNAKIDYTTGINPLSISLGDVNNDNKLDIVTANYNDLNTVGQNDTVSVLLNQ